MQDGWHFEWDPRKSESNRRKHGMAFEDAKAMWDDPFICEAPIFGSEEGRRIAVARVGHNTYWTAVFVYRGDGIRIISVRKSMKKEIDIYAGN